MFRTEILRYFEHSNSLLVKDIQTGIRLSYKEAFFAIKHIATVLKKHDIESGDRIAVVLSNSLDFLLLYLTCLLQRVIICPVNPQYGVSDLDYCIKLSGSKKVATNKNIDGIGIPVINLKEFSFQESSIRLSPNITIGGSYQKEDLFSITFTSGTTGKPKAIGHYAETHLANADTFNQQVGNSNTQRMLHVMPMFYMAGILNTILCPLVAGGSIVLDTSFGPLSPITFWKNFMENNCTTAWLSPTMIQSILKLDRNEELLDELRNRADHFSIFSGTAPLSDKSKKEFYEKYKIMLLQSYGLSETLFVSVKEHDKNDFNRSVGTVLDGIDIIFDSDGEIILDTNYMMAGYLNEMNHFENEDNRKFKTGDLGEIKDKELFITGRKKELIIKGGENINPKEIENVIQKLPFIESVAVVGFEDEFYGEDIAAFITTENTNEKDVEKAIRKICKEQLKPSLMPAKIIIVNEMPLTPTGKIQKKKLSV